MKQKKIAPDYEYDHIEVQVKRDKANPFRRCYEEFGWEQTDRRADRQYGNIVHLSFRRPHRMLQKDALQLQQVRLEIAWNKIGRYEAAKTARAVTAISLIGAFSAALLAGGILLLCFFWGALWAYIAGSACCAVAVVCGIAGVFISRSIAEKDRIKYNELIGRENEELLAICRRARALRGGQSDD